MLLVSWHTVIGDIAVTVYFCNMIFSSTGNARLAYSVLCNFCVSTPSMVQKAFVQVITSASMICNLSHLKDRPRCTPSGTVSQFCIKHKLSDTLYGNLFQQFLFFLQLGFNSNIGLP